MINKYYTLQKNIDTGFSPSIKGVYYDIKNRNKLVFIKSLYKYNLYKKEVNNHKYIYRKYRVIFPSDVIIPKLLGTRENINGNYIITQYITNATPLKFKSTLFKIQTYIKILIFLELLNDKKNRINIPISKKSTIHQIITLPYFLSKDIFYNFLNIQLFIKAYLKLLKYFPDWLTLKTDYLCHGDINAGNILVVNRKIGLLDFSEVCKSHKYYDMSRCLNSFWSLNDFHDKLLIKIISVFNLDKDQERLLKSFIIENLLERLSQKYSNKAQTNFYIYRLKHLLLQI